MGLRERRRHVQGGDDRDGLRDPRQVRLRGPGGREARVRLSVGRAVRQEQEPAAAVVRGRRAVRRPGGAGQRHVRLHRLHQEPVRDGQRADHQPERHGQEQGAQTGAAEGRGRAPAATAARRLLSRHRPRRTITNRG